MNVDKTQAMPVGLGAGAGLLVGAGAGAVVAGKRPAAAEYKKAVSAFAEARDKFVGSSKNYADGIKKTKDFIKEQDTVKAAEEELAKAVKAQKDLAADATDKAKKAAEKAVELAKEKSLDAQRKSAVEFLNKDENKKLKAGVDKMVKNFTEGKGKKLNEAVDTAKKALKTTKVKWVAGLAAAGIALGAGAGILFNKIKAGKAEQPAEEQAQ